MRSNVWRRLIAAAAFGCSFAAGPQAFAQEQPAAPPQVQRPGDVDLAYFQERLAPFGRWFVHPKWGEVWQPDSGPDFRPYFYGNWEYTSDYGWLWVSSEPYGDIVYHYGRWVYDPDDGWLWVPGYVWAPSWVVWRDTGEYVGWLPMPPDYADFDTGTEIPTYGIDLFYGYQGLYGAGFVADSFPALWVFCRDADFGHHDRRHYVTDRKRLHDLYRQSHDRTDYRHDRGHDRIVDRSIDPAELERHGHSKIAPLPAARFLRRDIPVMSVSLGREVFRREHDHVTPPPSATIIPPAMGHRGGGPESVFRGNRAGLGTPAGIAGGEPASPHSEPSIVGRRPEGSGVFRPHIPHTDGIAPSPSPAAGIPAAPAFAAPHVLGFRAREHGGLTRPRIAGPAIAPVTPVAPTAPVGRGTAPFSPAAPVHAAPFPALQTPSGPAVVGRPPAAAQLGRRFGR